MRSALTLHADPLVRAPRSHLGEVRQIDAGHADMGGFPMFVVYGRPMISHPAISSVSRSPICDSAISAASPEPAATSSTQCPLATFAVANKAGMKDETIARSHRGAT